MMVHITYLLYESNEKNWIVKHNFQNINWVIGNHEDFYACLWYSDSGIIVLSIKSVKILICT